MSRQAKTTLRLTDEDTPQEAVERLSTYLPLQVSGYECGVETVFDVLIKAAATKQTTETTCKELDNTVQKREV